MTFGHRNIHYCFHPFYNITIFRKDFGGQPSAIKIKKLKFLYYFVRKSSANIDFKLIHENTMVTSKIFMVSINPFFVTKVLCQTSIQSHYFPKKGKFTWQHVAGTGTNKSGVKIAKIIIMIMIMMIVPIKTLLMCRMPCLHKWKLIVDT